jgi:hypothetical protein
MLTFKAGLGNDRLPDLTVTPLDGTTVFFSPAVPLREGEYIISTVSMGNMGYDFGFAPWHTEMSWHHISWHYKSA